MNFILIFSSTRKANLILHRVEKISHYCRSLLRSTHIQSRTDTMAYVYCRSEEGRPTTNTRHGSLHESRTTCMEKLISVQRNTYSNTKLRWDEMSVALSFFFSSCKNDISDWCTRSVTLSSKRLSSDQWLFFEKKQNKTREPKKNLRIHWTSCSKATEKNIFLCGLLLI